MSKAILFALVATSVVAVAMAERPNDRAISPSSYQRRYIAPAFRRLLLDDEDGDDEIQANQRPSNSSYQRNFDEDDDNEIQAKRRPTKSSFNAAVTNSNQGPAHGSYQNSRFDEDEEEETEAEQKSAKIGSTHSSYQQRNRAHSAEEEQSFGFKTGATHSSYQQKNRAHAEFDQSQTTPGIAGASFQRATHHMFDEDEQQSTPDASSDDNELSSLSGIFSKLNKLCKEAQKKKVAASKSTKTPPNSTTTDKPKTPIGNPTDSETTLFLDTTLFDSTAKPQHHRLLTLDEMDAVMADQW